MIQIQHWYDMYFMCNNKNIQFNKIWMDYNKSANFQVKHDTQYDKIKFLKIQYLSKWILWNGSSIIVYTYIYNIYKYMG